MLRTNATQIFLIALASAWLLASTQIQRPETWPLTGLYAYWTVRILLEAGLFVAFLELLGRLPRLKNRIWLAAGVAAQVSLVPFALAVTALDLILGLPELDELVGVASAGAPAVGETRIGSFLLELVYLSDNHLALCFLLSLPLLFSSVKQSSHAEKDSTPIAAKLLTTPLAAELESTDPGAQSTRSPPSSQERGFERHLDPPLSAPVLRVEAQEHYVRLTTKNESRMVLYRFNDIVSELPSEAGMQVHRSHWVAFETMEGIGRKQGRLWLELTDGSNVPVSRKYAQEVRDWIALQEHGAKKAAT